METAAYKTVGDIELAMGVYRPDEKKYPGKRPAIILFFGGSWNVGEIKQFTNQCNYLAERGMVCFTPEYRINSKHGVTPFECADDAADATEWVLAHAGEYSADPDRIAIGGGSAGGHLAACVTMMEGRYREAGKIPKAMVLFNPALDPEKSKSIHRFEGRAAELSPLYFIRPGLPPAIIFNGDEDTLVSIEIPREFCEKMRQNGNFCELVEYPGQEHGFFNIRNGNDKYFLDTIQRTEVFLKEQGLLD